MEAVAIVVWFPGQLKHDVVLPGEGFHVPVGQLSQTVPFKKYPGAHSKYPNKDKLL